MRFQACISFVLAALTANAFAQSAPVTDPQIDANAIHILQVMTKAYRGIHHLQQDTIYSAEDNRVINFVRSKLVLQRPNHVSIELYQDVPAFQEPVVTRFQCDGKFVYSYLQEKGYYTREKAPKGFDDFKLISSSLEMAAITGLDPFAMLVKQSRAVRLEPSETVDGVATDVVVLDSGTPDKTANTKLYIGQQDHLIRRFVFESIPIEKPAPPKPDPAVPQYKDPNEAPPPINIKPRAIRMAYENHVILDKEPPKDSFTWVTPSNAFLYQERTSILDPNKVIKPTAGAASYIPPGSTKPIKIISLEEAIKQGQKKKK
jgi:hypothetical protein